MRNVTPPSKSKRSQKQATEKHTENTVSARVQNQYLRPWQKGQSGNPGGRPKTLPITSALRLFLDELQLPKRAHPSMTVAERIALRLARKAEKVGDKAAVEVMDRVEGKARQRTELSGPDGGAIPIELPDTREGLERRIAELLKG